MGEVTLKITGLSDGMYAISVDGSKAGEYTAAKLQSGIPIAFASAQAMQKASALDDLVRLRTFMYLTRWRQIELQPAGFDRAMPTGAGLDSLINETAEHARTLATPHEYHVAISKM